MNIRNLCTVSTCVLSIEKKKPYLNMQEVKNMWFGWFRLFKTMYLREYVFQTEHMETDILLYVILLMCVCVSVCLCVHIYKRKWNKRPEAHSTIISMQSVYN